MEVPQEVEPLSAKHGVSTSVDMSKYLKVDKMLNLKLLLVVRPSLAAQLSSACVCG